MSSNDKKAKVHNTPEQTRASVIRMFEDIRDKTKKNNQLLTHDYLFKHPTNKSKPISLYYHISSQYNSARFRDLKILKITSLNKGKYFERIADLSNQEVLEKLADDMISIVREYDRISNEKVQKKKAADKNLNNTQKNLFTTENEVKIVEIEDDYPTLLKLQVETNEQLRRESDEKSYKINELYGEIESKNEVIRAKNLRILQLEFELEENTKKAEENAKKANDFYISVHNSCSKFTENKFNNSNVTIKQ